jgi:hemerythrin-like domain-containing protein
MQGVHMTIHELMSGHHRDCDDSFAKLENSVAEKKWSNPAVFEEFLSIITKHFHAEENVLFAALENKMGGRIGPTMVMRQEHQQMTLLLDQMKEAFAAKDREKFLSLSDTWMVVAQQHNMKEEEILYPMMDDALKEQAPGLIHRAQEILKQP